MWEKSYEVITHEVTPKQIWQVWSDINRWSDWDDAIEYARTSEPFGAGCRFELKPKQGPKVTIKIIESQPESYFVDETRFPLAIMYGKHEMAQMLDGALKLKTTMSVKGPLAFLWRRLVAQQIVDDLPVDTAKIIEIAKKRPA